MWWFGGFHLRLAGWSKAWSTCFPCWTGELSLGAEGLEWHLDSGVRTQWWVSCAPYLDRRCPLGHGCVLWPAAFLAQWGLKTALCSVWLEYWGVKEKAHILLESLWQLGTFFYTFSPSGFRVLLMGRRADYFLRLEDSSASTCGHGVCVFVMANLWHSWSRFGVTLIHTSECASVCFQRI